MILNGINFGDVIAASGTLNFFGDGYWFHKLLKRFKLLDYSGVTFVAKTSTLLPREGNMPLWPGTTIPKELKPKCIIVNPFKGIALNAVGLSGPGILALLKTGRWQERTDPFFISFMSVDPNPESHIAEFVQCVNLLGRFLKKFEAPIGLKINFSCPNVGLELESDELYEKVCKCLVIGSRLGIPLIPKFNAMLSPETAVAIAGHDACSAICVSNSIPFGELSERINWENLFGSGPSPLAHIDPNGGGLSGKPLLPIVIDWVKAVKQIGISKPVIAGGGILSVRDADTMINEAGADAISLGSVFILRPWRVQSIIRHAKKVYSRKEG